MNGGSDNTGGQEAAVRSQKKTEDVLVKVIRIIANISIAEDIGMDIASREDCLELLLNILGQLLVVIYAEYCVKIIK